MSDLRISHLCDAPDAVPVLAESFLHESPDYFRGQSAADVAARLLTPTLQRDALPLALVAHLDGEVTGTVALRHDSISAHPHLGPWVAALHVLPARRGRGIGTALVAAAERDAERLGYARLYAGTTHASSLFERQGWVPVERTPYWGEPLVLLRRDVREDAAIRLDGDPETPILVFLTLAPASDADRAALARGLVAIQQEHGPVSVQQHDPDGVVLVGATNDEHLDRVVDVLKRVHGVHAAVSRPHVGEREQPIELHGAIEWVPVEPWMEVLVRTPPHFVERILVVMPQELPTVVTYDESGGDATLGGCFPLESILGLTSAIRHLTHGEATAALHFRWYRPLRRPGGPRGSAGAPAWPRGPAPGPALRARASVDESV
jgi:predicted N-acetyltransferase YhbS